MKHPTIAPEDRMTYTESNRLRIVTDTRNVTVLLLRYLSIYHKKTIASLGTGKFKGDRTSIVSGYKKWMAREGYTATFGGDDGYERVEGKIYQFVYDYFLYRALEGDYKEFLQVNKVTEAEMAKKFQYKTEKSWKNSVGRIKRVAELVTYWRIIREYVEAKRG